MGGLLDADLQDLKFKETKIEKIHSPHLIMPDLVQVCVAVSTPSYRTILQNPPTIHNKK